jgi:tetratricopeptide (TPR) repeat protein
MFLLIFFINLTCHDVFCQNTTTKPTRQSSLETFSNGNYEQAFKEFQELLLTYSKDPLYKYYSGVCLVKLSRAPESAVNFLTQALLSAGVVKALPSDAYFYLGRAQQMSGGFREAVESFNLFTEIAGKKASKEMGVPEFVKQCNEKSGQIAEPEIKTVAIIKKDTVNAGKIETKLVKIDVVNQSVVKESIPKINLPVAYDKILGEAIAFQFKADSINSLLIQQKKDLENLTNPEKAALKIKISENELHTASFQKSADQKYSEAQAALNPAQPKPIQKEPLQQTSNNNPVKDSIPKSVNKIVDEVKQQPDTKILKEADKQADTIKKIAPVVQKQAAIFSFFEVLEKPVSDPKGKIIVDGEVPQGLIYRIQIAVFRNRVTPSYFRGITPVYGFRVPGTDKTNYFAGMFRRVSDAGKALNKVKTKGFRDAFVVAFIGNKTVSTERAAIMEKEWGKRPFITVDKSVQEVPLDTIPPALSFRVEVIRLAKPLKDDAVEGIKKMAGSRGLDIQALDDGNIVYLVGKFITFESAAEYADLLLRNGYREAKVVAFLGKREIPVETAKQLIENLE